MKELSAKAFHERLSRDGPISDQFNQLLGEDIYWGRRLANDYQRRIWKEGG